MRIEDVGRALEGIGKRDHGVTTEYQMFGPPGTGKTWSLADQAERAAKAHGPNKLLVTSFSRSAAAEITDRHLPIGPDRIGTLHSFCWQALGGPKIAEAHVAAWNQRYPGTRLTTANKLGRLDGEQPGEDDDTRRAGDLLLQELNRYRGQMLDTQSWPLRVRDFAGRWEEYKRSEGLLDFCDLIDYCHRDVAVAPGAPAVILADEAQDLNRMQLTLLRKWGRRAEYFVIALDDDQTIYSFTGASPDALLEAVIPQDHIVILEQSHRVPHAIHQFADQLIHRVSRRQEKVYRPRPAAGAVHRISAGYKCPDYAILSSAVKHLEQGKTVMFLAACSYMLQPLIQVLRKHAIPFHNPYRRSNGHWNPLRLGKGSAASRILALLVAHPDYGAERHPWTHSDLARWSEWLRPTGILKTNAADRLRQADGKERVPLDLLIEIFDDGVVASLLATFDGNYRALLDWWRNRVILAVRNRIQFPAEIVARLGPKGLIEPPRAVVGTIHSVKGGEADVVYLFPDLSPAGDAQYQIAGPPRDSMIRVFYVAATRARETLHLCGRETNRSIVM